MRWLVGVTVLAVVSMFLVQATAQAPGSCTRTGTPKRDVLTGSSRADVLCAKKGPDYLHGAGGKDLLKAGGGADVVVGGGDKDTLKGGKGSDRLFAVNGKHDVLKGGKGNDQCFFDKGDKVGGCERKFVGTTLREVQASDASLLQVMVIAAGIEGTLPPTVTVTQTQTITLPPCSQGPPDPPPFCDGG